MFPVLVDELASSQPSRPFASMPVSADARDMSEGYRDVDVAGIARGVNRMAWWIEEQCGRIETFETLAFMEKQDLRYQIVQITANKCGY